MPGSPLSRRRKVRPHNPNAISPRPFIGTGLVAVAFFPYAASGLLAPWWGVVLLLAVWATLLVLACRWWQRHPTRVLWVGVVSIPLWFVLVNAGAWLLDWTA